MICMVVATARVNRSAKNVAAFLGLLRVLVERSSDWSWEAMILTFGVHRRQKVDDEA